MDPFPICRLGIYFLEDIQLTIVKIHRLTNCRTNLYDPPCCSLCWTGQGECAGNLHEWWIASSDKCPRGQPQMKPCSMTKLPDNGLRQLHSADDNLTKARNTLPVFTGVKNVNRKHGCLSTLPWIGISEFCDSTCTEFCTELANVRKIGCHAQN